MKKLLAAVFAVSTMSVFACWFTESSFNATYIASVNGKVVHYRYVPETTKDAAVYNNGQAADLPITVQVKVSNRTEQGQALTIKTAKLQYKIVRQDGTSTPFITVKTIDKPSWKMNFNNPVNLFGRDGIINIPDNQISKDDEIIIRLWLDDGIYNTGDINADITVDQVHNVQKESPNTSAGEGSVIIGTDGWAAPHVFRVKFSGKRRLMI